MIKDVHNHIAIFWTSRNLHPCTGNRSTSFGADEPSEGAKRGSIDGWPSSCCFQALAYESTSAVRRVLVAAIAVIAQARKNHTQTRQTVADTKDLVNSWQTDFKLRFLVWCNLLFLNDGVGWRPAHGQTWSPLLSSWWQKMRRHDVRVV